MIGALKIDRSLYWEADMRTTNGDPQDRQIPYCLRNGLTARSVEGRVPKRNVGLVRYRRETDCPADSGQLVASGKLVQILVKQNVLFDSNVNRCGMFLFIFFTSVLVWALFTSTTLVNGAMALSSRHPAPTNTTQRPTPPYMQRHIRRSFTVPSTTQHQHA